MKGKGVVYSVQIAQREEWTRLERGLGESKKEKGD
jgi:hypothetical protein